MLGVFVALLAPTIAGAQSSEYTLDDSGDWVQDHVPEPGSDEAVMADATALLAADQPSAAYRVIDRWISDHDHTNNKWLARAYLLHGDALLAMGDELEAMTDYERQIIQKRPQSDEFVTAIERELGIAERYAHGLRRKFLGLRIVKSGDIAEETFIRVQERLPGSALAERAAIDLSDYYYDAGNLTMAATAYDLYVANFPSGPNIERAMERRIRTNVALYKGPQYDGSSLIDAREQTRAFERLFPAQAEKTALDERLVRRLDDALADQMLAGAQWYLKRRDQPSARFMLKRLLQRHPNSPAAADALNLIVEYGWAMPTLQTPDSPESVEPTDSSPTGEHPS